MKFTAENNINQKNTCCFSGHRIVKSQDYDNILANLDKILETLYNKGITNFISGGALGFDTLAAESVIKLRSKYSNIRLILALPCKDQACNIQNFSEAPMKSYMYRKAIRPNVCTSVTDLW